MQISTADWPLTELSAFALVAEHAGYTAAERASGVPKSRLSRQVAALEARLGVRLLQRSTRRFQVTELGQQVLQHCRGMLDQAEAALLVAASAQAEPAGLLRVACPVALAQTQLAPTLPGFLARYPKLRLELAVANRRVDVIAEGFDCALRVRTRPSGEDGLVMRGFGQLSEVLVAAPGVLAQRPPPTHPDELASWPVLSFGDGGERPRWALRHRDGSDCVAEPLPRLHCHDFPVLRQAALAGLGIALLPESVIRADLDQGRLVPVLPDWCLPQGVLHVVFPSRRGVLPALRAFLDFLGVVLADPLRLTWPVADGEFMANSEPAG
ncbi:MAG: LysR family transcriptional regulator [Xanthomonadales bacterium]|nr:LysR family transcriptional regulator [Xanthomonadales bacterium]